MFRVTAALGLVAMGTFVSSAPSTAQTQPSAGKSKTTQMHVVARYVRLSRTQAIQIDHRLQKKALYTYDHAHHAFHHLPANARIKAGLYASFSDTERVIGANAIKKTSLVAVLKPSTRAPGSNRHSSSSSSVTASVSTTGASIATPAGYSNADLVFSDSFSTKTLDASKWNPYISSGPGANVPWNSNGQGGSSQDNPSQNYNLEYDLPSHVLMTPNGLDLQATASKINGVLAGAQHNYPWTSSAVTTDGHFEFSGGYLQVEAKTPAGFGMWPAVWLLPGASAKHGNDFEIDLFEGGMTDVAALTNSSFSWHVHTPVGTFGGETNANVDLSGGYHTYGLAWSPGKQITWYLDGRQMATISSAQSPIPTEQMEILISLGVAAETTAGWHSQVNSATPTTNDFSISGIQVYS